MYCIHSPTKPDVLVSGQMNFISNEMDTEDFDDFICDIYEGHPEVMEDLTRKFEVSFTIHFYKYSISIQRSFGTLVMTSCVIYVVDHK